MLRKMAIQERQQLDTGIWTDPKSSSRLKPHLSYGSFVLIRGVRLFIPRDTDSRDTDVRERYEDQYDRYLHLLGRRELTPQWKRWGRKHVEQIAAHIRSKR